MTTPEIVGIAKTVLNVRREANFTAMSAVSQPVVSPTEPSPLRLLTLTQRGFDTATLFLAKAQCLPVLYWKAAITQAGQRSLFSGCTVGGADVSHC